MASTMLAGCGGGGGGGGGPRVTTPSGGQFRSPVQNVPFNVDAAEFGNTPHLKQLELAGVYRRGLSGRGAAIGVVDSGVQSNHEELDGKVIGGGDWQESGDGARDPFGHGTHVASIIAASRNDRGIHGVAPGAGIVSYRILDENGNFGQRRGNHMVPALLGNAESRNLPVINNSWASYYEINDIGKSSLDHLLREELIAYRRLAREDGPVMVWAAGNSSAGQVSIRSGLPYHYRELEPNWLTVVAVDPLMHEPLYTNRCGVSRAWCLAAPGGGDNQLIDGVLAAHPNGGYTRRSGTSMAAPFVSGAIALVMESLPGLSPRKVAARLLATAGYERLTTADGCTLERCGEEAMADVFGQGMININAALEPISTTSIDTGAGTGKRFRLEESYLVAPRVLGGSVNQALTGKTMVVRDDFDNAPFVLPVNYRIENTTLPYFSAMAPVASLNRNRLDQMGFLAGGSGYAPAPEILPAQLMDIGGTPADHWVGINHSGRLVDSQIMTSYSEARQAVHMVLSQGDGGNQRWIGGGMDYQSGWQDGQGAGAFSGIGTASFWGFGGVGRKFGTMTVTAEMLIGRTRLDDDNVGLIRGGSYDFDAARLGFEQPLDERSMVSFDVTLPPAVRSGALQVHLPASIEPDTGATLYRDETVALRLDDREARIDLGLVTRLTPEVTAYAGVGVSDNDLHRHDRRRRYVSIGISGKF